MKPIRFYHWWIYRLFYATWDPILRERPYMVKYFRDNIERWLSDNGS